MLEGRVHSSDYTMNATRSVYGWVVTRTCESSSHIPRSHHRLKTEKLDVQTQDLLTRSRMCPPAPLCIQKRANGPGPLPDDQEDGVQLPRKAITLSLGCSREQAQRRHQQNERSLTRKEKWVQFQEAVQDYSTRGHSEKVPPTDLRKPETDVFYLPMHGVIKEACTTTKLRVVFDASARTSSGVSLNDQLLPGPNLYPHLTAVIISFRQHRIGMTSDISKMFREIGLHNSESTTDI